MTQPALDDYQDAAGRTVGGLINQIVSDGSLRPQSQDLAAYCKLPLD
jgi:hypothetical protein